MVVVKVYNKEGACVVDAKYTNWSMVNPIVEFYKSYGYKVFVDGVEQ